MFARFHTIIFCAFECPKNVRYVLSSTKLANRNDIHQHLALLLRFCDSAPHIYETPYLLTYLLTCSGWVGLGPLCRFRGLGWICKIIGWVRLIKMDPYPSVVGGGGFSRPFCTFPSLLFLSFFRLKVAHQIRLRDLG